MKPSSDKPRQIADIHAVRRRSGDRVPMRMEGWELSTETYNFTLSIDFQNASLLEDMADHRLSESKLCSSLEMDLADQECKSFERIASGIVEQIIHFGSPPGKRRQCKRQITEDGHISLFECSLPEIEELVNLINEPPISTSYEDGLVSRASTSEPPGSTDRSLAIAYTSPPGSTSYSLSEGFRGDHMQSIQAKVDTSTKSVSLGMRNGKHSLLDYHPYPVNTEHSYSSPGIISHDQMVRVQHL